MASLAAQAVPALPDRAAVWPRALWLAARYRCAEDAALAADRIRREVGADGAGGTGPLVPRLSGATLVVDFEPSHRDELIRLVRRTHGRLIAI